MKTIIALALIALSFGLGHISQSKPNVNVEGFSRLDTDIMILAAIKERDLNADTIKEEQAIKKQLIKQFHCDDDAFENYFEDVDWTPHGNSDAEEYVSEFINGVDLCAY